MLKLISENCLFCFVAVLSCRSLEFWFWLSFVNYYIVEYIYRALHFGFCEFVVFVLNMQRICFYFVSITIFDASAIELHLGLTDDIWCPVWRHHTYYGSYQWNPTSHDVINEMRSADKIDEPETNDVRLAPLCGSPHFPGIGRKPSQCICLNGIEKFTS